VRLIIDQLAACHMKLIGDKSDGLNNYLYPWSIEQEEHDAIAKNRNDPDAPVTWAEYRSMTFTNQVSIPGPRCAPY
jgi:hypothetical protein